LHNKPRLWGTLDNLIAISGVASDLALVSLVTAEVDTLNEMAC